MRLKAYQLYDQAVALQPASSGGNWAKDHALISANHDLPGAAVQGWQLLCPLAFEATWNGGPNAADIEIRLAEEAATQPAFVQSNLGEGLLTFYPGYQFKTEEEHLLWVRGPVNAPKAGLSPLERLVDASLLPCTVTVYWQFTRPHQTIRFAAGEPFATLLLYPKTALQPVHVEMRQADAGEQDYAQAFQQLIDTPALHDLFLRLGATPAAPRLSDGQTAPSTGVARSTNPLPDGCFDTIDGRLDLGQFDPAFFLRDRLIGKPQEDYLRRYGEINRRMFYVLDALKLAYLETPKVACTAIKMVLAHASGISFERGEGFEYLLHIHPQWHREAGRLNRAQSGYYRFSFVRNPFDRLVSCYRQKILFTPTAKTRSPHFHGYFFAIPPNISFADFVERVSQIPDALADAHFKSQHTMLYSGDELQVDYLGKFEQLEADWRPIAERYRLDPVLEPANVSKTKPGCPRDYRLYYTEPLARLVYERYRKDVHLFGYEEEYEQLLAFVRQQRQNDLPAVCEWEQHKEKESGRHEN
jgi:chondroitin 4-sulfotransferase 11